MPKWIATNKGKPWTNKNGRLYYISEWIDGEPLGGDARDYAKLGETLALLHTMSRRRRPASSSFSIRDIARLQRHNRIFASDLRAVRTKPGESGNWYSKHGLQCLKLAEDAWRILSGSDVERTLRSERPTLIHGDVTRPNVIVGRHGLYLVDWELARFGSAYYEAAKALSNVAYFSIPNMRAFLAGYENYSPLSQEERRIIAALFRLPREAWIVAAQLRSGSQAPLLNVLKAAWNDRMQAVRWMDGWADEQPEKIGVVMHMATMEEEAGNEFDRRH